MPDGLARVLEGTIELGEPESDNVGGGGGGDSESSDSAGRAAAGSGMDRLLPSAAPEGASGGDGGGCTAAGSWRGALPSAVWLLLAGLALAWRRRT